MGESQYFLGIDGGGTGCRARVADAAGRTLGEGVSGPANLGLGIEIALNSVMDAVYQAFTRAGIGPRCLQLTHAGLGMAAANVPKHREALERARLPFMSVAIRSDAETACLGAHAGAAGGILILGTGSQGVVYTNGIFKSVGGWGFALSDSGSGSILGRSAVRRAFLAHEGMEPATSLTQEVMRRFNFDLVKMLDWAEQAKPRDWANFARDVFAFAEQGDKAALALVQESASAAEQMLARMIDLGARQISLMGGLAQPIRPYLSEAFNRLIVEPKGDAMDGALLLARASAARQDDPAGLYRAATE